MELEGKNFKAIVFDYDGVIKISPGLGKGLLEDIAASISVPLDDFRNAYFKTNHLSNVENMPWDQMILRIVSSFDNSEESKREVLSIIHDFRSKSKLNTELLALFPKIRRKNLTLAIFSNNTSALREELRSNRVLELVDDVVISGEIGFQKPSVESFDALFSQLNVRSKEVVFIDDTPKSLETASVIGYTPILFENNEQLRSDLHKLGIIL